MSSAISLQPLQQPTGSGTATQAGSGTSSGPSPAAGATIPPNATPPASQNSTSPIPKRRSSKLWSKYGTYIVTLLTVAGFVAMMIYSEFGRQAADTGNALGRKSNEESTQSNQYAKIGLALDEYGYCTENHMEEASGCKAANGIILDTLDPEHNIHRRANSEHWNHDNSFLSFLPVGPLPETRTTVGVLWTSILTVVISSWIILRPNLPEQRKEWQQKYRRFIWFILTWLAPELVTFTAYLQFVQAAEISSAADTAFKRGANTIHEAGSRSTSAQPKRRHEWTSMHSYYAVMGGFAFDTGGAYFLPGVRRRMTLTSEGLMFLLKNNPEVIPDISEDFIRDRSKSDMFATSLVGLQILWVLAQFVARWVGGLSVMPQEVTVIAHSASMLFVWVLWRNKPVEVTMPITIEAETVTPEIGRKSYAPASQHLGQNGRLFERMDHYPYVSGYKYLTERIEEFPVNFPVEFQKNPISIAAFLIPGLLYGIAHLCVDILPRTGHERVWPRASTMVTLLSILITKFLFWHTYFLRNAARNVKSMTYTSYSAVLVWLILYVACRLYVMIYSLVNLEVHDSTLNDGLLNT